MTTIDQSQPQTSASFTVFLSALCIRSVSFLQKLFAPRQIDCDKELSKAAQRQAARQAVDRLLR